MSVSKRQPSFLCVVPTWRRGEAVVLDVDDDTIYRARRESNASTTSYTSSISTLSSLSSISDYGENGFLVLTDCGAKTDEE